MDKRIKVFYYIAAVISAHLYIILKSGFWVMPNLPGQFLVAEHPFVNVFGGGGEDYIIANYLQPFLFHLIGSFSEKKYLLFVGLTSSVFLTIFVIWFTKKYGIEESLKRGKLFVSLSFPVFFVPFYWLGMDGMTLLLMLMIMVVPTRPWKFFFGFLLGLQHFSQGFLAFFLLFLSLLPTIRREERDSFDGLRTIFFILLGIFIGKVGLYFWFLHCGIEIGNRFLFLWKHIGIFCSQFKQSWPYVLYSLLGVGWLVVLSKISQSRYLLTVVIIDFFLLCFVGDQTRVGSILLFPSLYYWIFSNDKIIESLSGRLTVAVLIAYLLFPIVYVWGGPFGSLLDKDLVLIKSLWNGGLPDLLIPFK